VSDLEQSESAHGNTWERTIFGQLYAIAWHKCLAWFVAAIAELRVV